MQADELQQQSHTQQQGLVEVAVQRPGQQEVLRRFAAPGAVACSLVTTALQQEFGPGSLCAAGSAVVLLEGQLQPGRYVYNMFPGAAAAVIDMPTQLVNLSIEGGGAPLSVPAPLRNNKVHVTALEEYLATKRLSLVTINGSLPSTDSDGYSTVTYTPDTTLIVEAVPKPGVKVAAAYAHAVPKSRLLSLWT